MFDNKNNSNYIDKSIKSNNKIKNTFDISKNNKSLSNDCKIKPSTIINENYVSKNLTVDNNTAKNTLLLDNQHVKYNSNNNLNRIYNNKKNNISNNITINNYNTKKLNTISNNISKDKVNNIKKIDSRKQIDFKRSKSPVINSNKSTFK